MHVNLFMHTKYTNVETRINFVFKKYHTCSSTNITLNVHMLYVMNIFFSIMYKMSTTRIKKSYGIICCRKHVSNGFQVILIKKPITYHFCEFISGHYRKNDDKHLKKLFNNMTYHEKIDILSMKFDNMWYRMYRSNPDSFLLTSSNFMIKQYHKKKKKFDMSFLYDNGKRLRRLMSDSNNAETLWEIPKGRKKDDRHTKDDRHIKDDRYMKKDNTRESKSDVIRESKTEKSCADNNNLEDDQIKKEFDMDSAIREFYEETTIAPNKYNILWHLKPYIETYSDFGITYQNILYYAEAIGDWDPIIKFSNNKQIAEVSAIRWCGRTDLIHMALEKTTYKRLLNMFDKVRNKYKNYKKQRVVFFPD